MTGFLGGPLARGILRRYQWADMTGDIYLGKSKLEMTLGPHVWGAVAGKTVLDFGCGDGAEVVEIAQKGIARRVIGLDINPALLQRARARAESAGVVARCEFTQRFEEKADVILTLDAFEHFSDPALILRLMADLLKPDGVCLVSFGPPWYHPWGSHCLIFPWAHLVFTEKAVMDWRQPYKNDGMKRYCEGSGGVNQMTIARFERLVEESPFEFVHFRPVPIRKLKWAHNRLTREFTTAVVRAELRLRKPAA
jgi:SAM-dependent methyltransferase